MLLKLELEYMLELELKMKLDFFFKSYPKAYESDRYIYMVIYYQKVDISCREEKTHFFSFCVRGSTFILSNL